MRLPGRLHAKGPPGPRTLIAAFAISVLGLAGLRVPPAHAGGPLVSGGSIGVPGQPFKWGTSGGPVAYTTDGGPLGYLSNSAADARVAALFQVWQAVPTASISFVRAGPIAGIADGDVSNTFELSQVAGSCDSGQQSPVVYDANGQIFASLFGPYAGVIGFAGPCSLGPGGTIVSAWATLNGEFIDGSPYNYELTPDEFDGAFIHEFGHFIGLDHSQVNLNCLVGLPPCDSAGSDAAGLPTMFPYLLVGLNDSGGLSESRSLADDDKAWVSALYPEPSFNAAYGTVTGRVFFSDGMMPAQGVNVIARRVGSARTNAVSVVTGYLYTSSRGQSVTGTNTAGDPFGSRDLLLAGYYELPLPAGSWRIEVESLLSEFAGGSSVGPLSPPARLPGVPEFWDLNETSHDSTDDATVVVVTPGALITGMDIVLNGTPPIYDAFESDPAP